jgi:multidrug resistance efflux pump
VQTAVMAAPTDIVIAPATGSVKSIKFNERDTVEEAQDMIIFEDPDLEQNIERASLRLEEALSANGSSGKHTTVSPEAAAARASANALQQTLNIKSSALSRLKALQAQGLAVQRDVDRAQAEYFDAKAELSKAMERVTGSATQTTSTASLLSIADGEYNLLKSQRDRLLVKAPAKGRIIKMLQREGTTVRYGDPVAIFQHDDPKYVEAYLTREEALSVAVGDIATVYFPSFGKDLDFRVSDVDYASQLVSHRDGMYVMQQAGLTRDVLVRLVLSEDQYKDLVEQIVPGTSAEVIFSKFKFGSSPAPVAPVAQSAAPATVAEPSAVEGSDATKEPTDEKTTTQEKE